MDIIEFVMNTLDSEDCEVLVGKDEEDVMR